MEYSNFSSDTAIEVLSMASEIVSAHVSSTPTNPDDLPKLIQSIYNSLLSILGAKPSVSRSDPAVPIEESVTDDYIVCLEDGKRLKMLKRHLKTSFNMTPDEYRERWGLPADYPMVSPSYAQERSKLAVGIGLGRNRAGVKSAKKNISEAA